MAYETKVILALLSQQVAKAESVEEAYTMIVEAANVEGMELPTYEEIVSKLKKTKKKSN